MFKSQKLPNGSKLLLGKCEPSCSVPGSVDSRSYPGKELAVLFEIKHTYLKILQSHC
jgi:hypothetical protein